MKKCFIDKGTVPLRLNSERKIAFFSGNSRLLKERPKLINSEEAIEFTPDISQISERSL